MVTCVLIGVAILKCKMVNGESSSSHFVRSWKFYVNLLIHFTDIGVKWITQETFCREMNTIYCSAFFKKKHHSLTSKHFDAQ